jgi:hypothetical protein
MDGETHHVTWETTRSEGRVVVFQDGRRLMVEDYNEHWGHIYQVPDDEYEIINAMTPLDQDEPDPSNIPDDAEMSRIAMGFSSQLMARMNPRDLRASEVGSYMLNISNSAVMMRLTQKHGNAEAAIRAAIA